MVKALCGNLLFKGVPRRSDDFKKKRFSKVEKTVAKTPEASRGEPRGMCLIFMGGAPRQACQGQKWGVRPARHAKARSGGCALPGARGSGGREPPSILAYVLLGIIFNMLKSL